MHHVYEHAHINRRKTEDFIRCFKQSRFRLIEVRLTFEAKVPPETQARLEASYPGYRHFANNGILAILGK